MTASPHSVTPTLTPGAFARPMARSSVFSFAQSLMSRIGSSVASMRQTIARMNKLIDDAQLDYPDQ